MDHQPPNVDECASSSVHPGGIEKGVTEGMELGDRMEEEVAEGMEQRAREEVEEIIPESDYFTPKAADVWPYIFDNLTDSKDVVSVMNALPGLHKLMKERRASTSVSALLSLALPVVITMQQNEELLTPGDILKCRLTNKQVQSSVDKAITRLQPNWIPEHTYTLHDLEQTQAFLNRIEGFPGNPFLSRYCETVLEDGTPEFPQVMEILQRYGHELLIIRFDEVTTSCPRRRMQIFKQVFSYLPNIEVLVLGIPEFNVANEAVWHNYRTSSRSLPPLPSLSTLVISYWNDNENVGVPRIVAFLRPVLFAYREQLRVFTADAFLFQNDPFNAALQFINLRDLTVSFTIGLSSEELSDIYWNLANLGCPQLESLALEGGQMRLTSGIFLALDNFRKTLRKLSMGSLEGDVQLFQVDPLWIREFPRLKQLSLCTLDIGTELMHLFRVQFTNLEEISFKPPKRNTRISAVPPVPTDNVARGFFTLFPNLHQLIWTQTEGGEEIAFKRMTNRIIVD
ncbi:hypothetical protein Ocin01_15757 [Orchesella cincta]|uniref:Uncharacterized protein n=1 Tax=Orchesella cincta TaxID=48709 RepID=A0A1D2MD40_ORCCI|nr:hypothetical protein Ocin01_15757 [Orchesella cincta]